MLRGKCLLAAHASPFISLKLVWLVRLSSKSNHSMDLVSVFDAILTSRQTYEKLQRMYEDLMRNNFRKRPF